MWEIGEVDSHHELFRMSSWMNWDLNVTWKAVENIDWQKN